ncbi:MAG: hypothetical protein GEU71_12105 [Actinobacteria bacterium]|nr:hypothetical protein [Actinomycetota bacterium]
MTQQFETLSPEAQQRVRLAVVAHVSPDNNSDDMTQAVKDLLAEHNEQIKEDLTTGLSVFRRQDAAERRQAFAAQTLPADYALLLRDDYREQYEQGVLPPLQSPWWQGILPLRRVIFETLQGEFQRAYKADLRQVETDLGVDVAEMLDAMLRGGVVEG